MQVTGIGFVLMEVSDYDSETLTPRHMDEEFSVWLQGFIRMDELFSEKLWLTSSYVVPAIVPQNHKTKMRALDPAISPQTSLRPMQAKKLDRRVSHDSIKMR